MADFKPAFEKMIRNEGGYKLHQDSGDKGGPTYAGIARNYHPNWPGWRFLDAGDLDDPELTAQVRDFYKNNFWDKIKCSQIEKQAVAETLFDFAVNAGYRTSAKLAQLVLDTTPDGIIGPKTLSKLNQVEENDFNLRYALAKIARYTQIVNRDRSQNKFLLGWINRTLKGVA
jgi:lysozyme family protein